MLRSTLITLVAIAGCHAPAEPTTPPFGEPQRNACGGVQELRVAKVTVDREFGDDTGSTATFDSWYRGQVNVDGEARAVLHEASPTTIAVSPGSHLFSLEADGHRRWEERVEIQPGTRVTFHVH